MKVTINEALVLMKVVRGRLGELSGLRQECSGTKRYYGDAPSVVEPNYDVKVLDSRCVELENFLLEAESAIKQSNAVVQIELTKGAQELLRPLT